MRTLIYKRTHVDDPDASGTFGAHGCMGRVRRWTFDAVIGVGGIGAEPRSHNIDGKVTWIGIGPHKAKGDKRGPLVTFDHFINWGPSGPSFENLAPTLAYRIYSRNVRAVMNDLSPIEEAEVARILARAKKAPPSPGRGAIAKPSRGCWQLPVRAAVPRTSA